MAAPASVPMTLGNMRLLGVRSLQITCEVCHHGAVLDVSRYPDERTVPSFRSKVRCSRCGAKGHKIDVRPDWREMKSPGR